MNKRKLSGWEAFLFVFKLSIVWALPFLMFIYARHKGADLGAGTFFLILFFGFCCSPSYHQATGTTRCKCLDKDE